MKHLVILVIIYFIISRVIYVPIIYRHVCLDEADRMMDMGFQESLDEILSTAYTKGLLNDNDDDNDVLFFFFFFKLP